MKVKVIFLAICVSTLLACNDAEQQPGLHPETVSPKTAPVLTPDPDPVKPDAVSVTGRKHLDTRITPDMIKHLNFDATGGTVENGSAAEMILNPSGKTQIMVTPKVFLDESETIKEGYIDYIDGAAVELEVKFD